MWRNGRCKWPPPGRASRSRSQSDRVMYPELRWSSRAAHSGQTALQSRFTSAFPRAGFHGLGPDLVPCALGCRKSGMMSAGTLPSGPTSLSLCSGNDGPSVVYCDEGVDEGGALI